MSARADPLAGRTLISDRKIREATFANLSYVADANGKHFALTFAGNDATLTAGGGSARRSQRRPAPHFSSATT